MHGKGIITSWLLTTIIISALPWLILAKNMELILTTRTYMTGTGKSVSKLSHSLLMMGRRSLPCTTKMVPFCVIAHTTNVQRAKALPPWMLCKSTWKTSSHLAWSNKKGKSWEIKPTFAHTVIILHKQFIPQPTSSETTAQAPILQVMIGNTSQVCQHSFVQDHTAHHINIPGLSSHARWGHEITITHVKGRHHHEISTHKTCSGMYSPLAGLEIRLSHQPQATHTGAMSDTDIMSPHMLEPTSPIGMVRPSLMVGVKPAYILCIANQLCTTVSHKHSSATAQRTHNHRHLDHASNISPIQHHNISVHSPSLFDQSQSGNQHWVPLSDLSAMQGRNHHIDGTRTRHQQTSRVTWRLSSRTVGQGSKRAPTGTNPSNQHFRPEAHSAWSCSAQRAHLQAMSDSAHQTKKHEISSTPSPSKQCNSRQMEGIQGTENEGRGSRQSAGHCRRRDWHP